MPGAEAPGAPPRPLVPLTISEQGPCSLPASVRFCFKPLVPAIVSGAGLQLPEALSALAGMTDTRELVGSPQGIP